MGTKDRKAREKELRKKLILDSAIHVLAEKGFDHTTMDDIAKESELSKGTIYLYFNDKSALYYEIKKSTLESIRLLFLDILQQDRKGVDMVIEMGKQLLEYIRSNPINTQSIVRISQECPDEKQDLSTSREILILITHALQIGMNDGTIRKEINPRIMAMQIAWGMFGIIQFFSNDGQDEYSALLKEHNTNLKNILRQFTLALVENIKTEPNS